ncbi:hypothetical protein U6B65_01405 [Oscillospiraceae bacterium MB08-C2-2]|nr:hypothetical protein U6B65_01405 [Oscillospiraceae bacterium MB08-C2-2]
MNNFYASVECLYRPELRKLPVAVGGDPEQRHGIVLAKNQIAKRKALLNPSGIVKQLSVIWKMKKRLKCWSMCWPRVLRPE